MAQLILDRPAIELIVCGVATSSDLETFRAAVEEESHVPDIAQNLEEQAPAAELEKNWETDPEKTEPTPEIQEEAPVTDEEREFLQDMARKRAMAVKDYLISRGVEAGRLIVCFAELEDKEDAVPRVEITL